jgi:cytolysin-activating lysine-acyltransferase
LSRSVDDAVSKAGSKAVSKAGSKAAPEAQAAAASAPAHPLAPPPAAARAAAPNAPLTPEMRARIGALRTHIQLSVGQVVLAVMDLPRYRHQTLADLTHLIVAPLLRDRIAIAHRQVKAADGAAPAAKGTSEGAGLSERAEIKVDEETIAGIAIWATVSDAVDAKITEQVRAGVFPLRLGAEDWTSGEQVWLLDVVAADRRQATAVLTSFRQVAGDRPVKIHPIVGRMIDPEVLRKLIAARQEIADKAAASPGEQRGKT